MEIKQGHIHSLPENWKETFLSDSLLVENWNKLTDIARNEWICWVLSAKKEVTQQKRFSQLVEQIKEGHKRPCCWPGCPHHNPKTAKWFN
jgi:uncharacterized protein YdeI (YjbR/CyaY-like superfamily)